MRLILWHGYLLSGTGSNIYTQHIARAWGELGHDVTVLCQEPHPEEYPMGPRVRVVRPAIGTLLPTFVVDRYEGLEARHVADLTEAELDAYVAANVEAIKTELEYEPAGLVLANHAIMGGPVAAAVCAPTGTPYAIKVHGSELEYAIRGRPQLAAMAREALNGAAAVFAGSQHIAETTAELVGDGPHVARTHLVPPGVDLDHFRPDAGSWDRLRALLDADEPSIHAERHPDPDAAARLAPVGRFVLYVGKLLHQKGVDVLLEAWDAVAPSHPDVSLVVVGFGSDRAVLEQAAGERVVFTGAMDHGQLAALVPLADCSVVPSVLPEAFGMVAAEAAACGVVPIVANHSGLEEVAAGLGEAARTFGGSTAELADRIDELLRLPDLERRRLGALGRERVAARWSWRGVAAQLIELSL